MTFLGRYGTKGEELEAAKKGFFECLE